LRELNLNPICKPARHHDGIRSIGGFVESAFRSSELPTAASIPLPP